MGILQQIQLTQILDLKWSQDLPSSDESLGYCLSIQKRKRTRTKLSDSQVTLMQTWASAREPVVCVDHPKQIRKHNQILTTRSSFPNSNHFTPYHLGAEVPGLLKQTNYSARHTPDLGVSSATN